MQTKDKRFIPKWWEKLNQNEDSYSQQLTKFVEYFSTWIFHALEGKMYVHEEYIGEYAKPSPEQLAEWCKGGGIFSKNVEEIRQILRNGQRDYFAIFDHINDVKFGPIEFQQKGKDFDEAIDLCVTFLFRTKQFERMKQISECIQKIELEGYTVSTVKIYCFIAVSLLQSSPASDLNIPELKEIRSEVSSEHSSYSEKAWRIVCDKIFSRDDNSLSKILVENNNEFLPYFFHSAITRAWSLIETRQYSNALEILKVIQKELQKDWVKEIIGNMSIKFFENMVAQYWFHCIRRMSLERYDDGDLIPLEERLKITFELNKNTIDRSDIFSAIQNFTNYGAVLVKLNKKKSVIEKEVDWKAIDKLYNVALKLIGLSQRAINYDAVQIQGIVKKKFPHIRYQNELLLEIADLLNGKAIVARELGKKSEARRWTLLMCQLSVLAANHGYSLEANEMIFQSLSEEIDELWSEVKNTTEPELRHFTFYNMLVEKGYINALLEVIRLNDGYLGKYHSTQTGILVQTITEFHNENNTHREPYLNPIEGFLCGALHDTGKILLSSEITYKPGRLNSRENALMRLHPVLGAYLLANLHLYRPALIALGHHFCAMAPQQFYSYPLNFDAYRAKLKLPDPEREESLKLLIAYTAMADTVDARSCSGGERKYQAFSNEGNKPQDIINDLRKLIDIKFSEKSFNTFVRALQKCTRKLHEKISLFPLEYESIS